MSYVVLARKYRPRSFDEMTGQDAVVRALTNALEQQRLHHAYLFTGTRGIGKTTVSRILAKSLNCTGPDGHGGVTARPCGVCSACTQIDSDRYIDYIELDAASTRGIDDIKDLLERAAYKPAVGRYKVFMIDEAHQLTKDAFNALLKTLEEPPDYLKFVLATTDPEKMLPTVLSRCLQFNLRPMAPETVREHLQRVLSAEGVAHDDGSLRLLARAARGSMRDALSLTDQAIAYGGGALVADGVRTMLGAVDRSHAAGFVSALAQRDARAVLAGVDALRDRGLSATGALDELCTLLQQMAVEQAVPGALDDADPDVAEVRELAQHLPPDETQLLYSVALRGRDELTLAPDEYAGLTMVLLRLFAFPPDDDGASPRRGGGSASGSQVSAQPPAAATRPSDAPASVVVAPGSASSGTRSAALRAEGGRDMARVTAVAAVPTPTPTPMTAPKAVADFVDTVTADTATGRDVLPRNGHARAPESAAPRAAAAPIEVRKPAPSMTTVSPEARSISSHGASSGATPPNRMAQAEPPPWLDDVPPDETSSQDLRESVTMPATRSTEPIDTAPPARDVPLQTTPLGDDWAAVVAQLTQAGAVVGLVRELALQAGLVARDDDAWTLVVERESLRGANPREKLQTALRTQLGTAVVLTVQAGTPTDSPARRQAAENARLQREAESTITNDPQVQHLLTQFKTARIVPGSIKHL